MAKKKQMKFNPKNKETLTFRETLEPTISITEQANADQYLKDYIAYIRKWLDKEPRQDNMTAEQIAKANLGYYAGYFDRETRIRVEKLFHCEHPFFGKATEHEVSPKEAFEIGKRLAEA